MPGEIVRLAAPIQDDAEFQVTLNDSLIPPDSVFYAGLTPGFAGLYQINVRVPPEPGDWPPNQGSGSGGASSAYAVTSWSFFGLPMRK